MRKEPCQIMPSLKSHKLRGLFSAFKPCWQFLSPVLGTQPAAVLIRETARRQWKLIAINTLSSLVDAISEGATLGVLFLAIKILSGSNHPKSIPNGNLITNNLPFIGGSSQILSPEGAFILLLLASVVLQAIQSLSRYVSLVSIGWFSARCKTVVLEKIHKQIMSFSFPHASSYKIGRLTTFSNQCPDSVRVEIEQLSSISLSIILITIYTAILIKISPTLSLAAIFIASVVVIVQRRIQPGIRRQSKSLIQIQSRVSSRITEDYQALRLLHTSGQLDSATNNLRSLMKEYEINMRGQSKRMALIGPVTSLLPVLAVAAIAGLSLTFLGRTNVLLASLVTFVIALQRLNSRITSIAVSVNKLADNTGKLEILNEILSPNGKEFRPRSGSKFNQLFDRIVLNDISLSYPNERKPSLSDINITINRGKSVALVGPSGAGKSSIADLLCGLYKPTAGSIFIDNKKMSEIDLSSWQQRIGVVSQDTFLFNASIADNIAFGTPSATFENIQFACKAAQASEFIDKLPNGYDTIVGERGYRLSGGQRQRLSLARAILRRPELLILDEATSALDSQSERLVQEAIENFDHEQTILVIAHRLSTIVNSDEIIVLDSGFIKERGSHSQLLQSGGLYSKLWNQQQSTHV